MYIFFISLNKDGLSLLLVRQKNRPSVVTLRTREEENAKTRQILLLLEWIHYQCRAMGIFDNPLSDAAQQKFFYTLGTVGTNDDHVG